MEMTNMTFQQLEDLCIELVQSDCDRSESLAAFSDAELQDVYVSVLRQSDWSLLSAVDEHSHWMSDSLLIYSNSRPDPFVPDCFLRRIVRIGPAWRSARWRER